MDIRGEFEKDFLKRPQMGSVEEDCVWAVKWAMERCAKEICLHNGVKLRHMFCCEHAQKICQLAKEME